MIRSGSLNRTIVLQRVTETIDAAGTAIRTWADFAVVRAELVTKAIAETGYAFGEADNDALVFRVRHYHGLTTADRVVYQGDTFDLAGIVEIGRNRVLELRCEAIA